MEKKDKTDEYVLEELKAGFVPSGDTEGLDYLTRLSYSAIARSDLDYADKRGLLYGVYSFRCLFDARELHRLSPVLVKYGCSFFTEDVGAEKYDHVYKIDNGGTTVYKFDAGSPLHRRFAAERKLPSEHATVPEKPTLYELALRCVTLNTATPELKGLWLVYFPYVFMLGAPIEYDVYDKLKAAVCTPEVFAAANADRYADNICCTAAELSGEDPMTADWYLPFVEWKCERNERGVSRETEKYQREIMLKNYEYAIWGTEKLLDSFPDDEEIMLMNVSAKLSLVAETNDLPRRVKLISESLATIDEALRSVRSPQKHVYFMYYSGLAKLGMSDPEGAEEDFRACLDLDPDFQPAMLLLNGLAEKKKQD